jgi:Flp pilus assembly pilin Flp
MKTLKTQKKNGFNTGKEKRFNMASRMFKKATCAKGQGTTEYAILVGVLVVIAIIAITAFSPQISELWTAIQDNILGISVPS